MVSSEGAALAVRMAFRERFLADRSAGVDRALTEYQAAFPAFAADVAEEHAHLTAGGTEPETDGAVPQAPERIGRYRIERELGRGGQGAVYLAVDEELGRRVAVKTLSAAWGASAAMLARLVQEGRVLASLDHPGVCQVFEAAHDRGLPYFVMRYVEGETLAARFEARKGPPDGADVAATVALIEKTARAAHAAHEAGVVHRDLKPANVMVADGEQPVVLDFGLAQAARDDGVELTASGDVLGTPHYMSPEQAAGDVRAIDRRSDVHALGVMLFEGVTGARPFGGTTRAALSEAVRTAPPPDPRKANPRVSADLRTVIETALAKAPADRYATALEFAEELRRVRLFEPIKARPIPWTGRLARFARRRPAIAALVAVLVVAVPTIGAFGGWYFANRDLVAAQRRAHLLADVEGRLEVAFRLLHGADPLGALSTFEAASGLLPSSVEAAAGAALARFDRGAVAEALAGLDAFRAAHGASPALDRLRVDALRRLQRFDEAAALDAATPTPSDHVGCFVEGQREFALAASGIRGAYDRAVERYAAAKDRAPRARRLYHQAFCRAVGRTNDERLARLAAASAPYAIGGWEGEAAAGDALMTVDPSAAIAAYERAVRLDPGYKYEYGVSITLSRTGRLDEAVDVARKLTVRSPDDATAFNNLSLIAMMRGDYATAVEASRKAVELRPDLPDMHGILGRALLRSGDRAAARESLRKAVEVGSDYAVAHLGWADFLYGERDFAGSEAAARRALALAPRMAEARCVIGKVLLARGSADDGFAVLKEAHATAPELTLAVLVEEAALCAEREDFEGGLRFLDAAARILDGKPLPRELAESAARTRAACEDP